MKVEPTQAPEKAPAQQGGDIIGDVALKQDEEDTVEARVPFRELLRYVSTIAAAAGDAGGGGERGR
jgi:hypothetical protein